MYVTVILAKLDKYQIYDKNRLGQ